MATNTAATAIRKAARAASSTGRPKPSNKGLQHLIEHLRREHQRQGQDHDRPLQERDAPSRRTRRPSRSTGRSRRRRRCRRECPASRRARRRPAAAARRAQDGARQPGKAIARVDRSRVMFPPGINAGSMLSSREQVAQLGHGIAEVADPRFDRDREADVARADVVAAGDVNQKIEADSRDGERLADVAMSRPSRRPCRSSRSTSGSSDSCSWP